MVVLVTSYEGLCTAQYHISVQICSMCQRASAFSFSFLLFTTNACVDEQFLSPTLNGKRREKGTRGCEEKGVDLLGSSLLNSLYIYIYIYIFFLPPSGS
jgi:hypothetical protein